MKRNPWLTKLEIKAEIIIANFLFGSIECSIYQLNICAPD